MSPLTDDQLERQLRARGDAPSSSLTAIARSATDLPQRHPAAVLAWPRMAIGAAAIAAALVVTVVASPLLRSPAVTPSTAATGASRSDLPTTTGSPSAPAPSGTARWSGITWSRADPEAFAAPIPVGAFSVGEVIPYRSGFIAVGDESGANGRRGRVWLTEDGRTWRSTTPAVLDGLMAERVLLVGDRLVLLAWMPVADGPTKRAMFTSIDGMTWQSAPDLPDDPGLGNVPWLMAGGPLGLLKVADTRLWTMGPDLANWTPIRRTGSTPHPVNTGQIVAGSDRWFWFGATGSIDPGAPPTAGAIWTSLDARSWTAAQVDRPGGNVSEIHVIAGGYVALGTEEGLPCRDCTGQIRFTRVAWFSTDGERWTRLDVAGSEPGDPLYQARVESDGHRLVAFGSWFVTPAGANTNAQATETIDGRTWTPVSVDGGGPRRNAVLAIGPPGVVGFDQVQTDSAGLMVEPWFATPVEAP